MLTLSRKTEYALIALTHLSQNPDDSNSAREIADTYGMPLPLLMNILKLLTQKKLARSSRGPKGGYSLALSAERITLSDIISAIEGPIHLVLCLSRSNSEGRETNKKCELTSCCPVRSPIHRVHAKMVEFLSKITLAELADNTAFKQPIVTRTTEA